MKWYDEYIIVGFICLFIGWICGYISRWNREERLTKRAERLAKGDKEKENDI